jgi:hypothetical protein
MLQREVGAIKALARVQGPGRLPPGRVGFAICRYFLCNFSATVFDYSLLAIAKRLIFAARLRF